MTENSDKPAQSMKNGTLTKALFVKHMALEDWEALRTIQQNLGGASVAEALRHAIRKTSGRL